MRNKLEIALREIREGKVICHQSDTVPGLAASSENEKAIRRLYEIKKQPLDKPILMLVSDHNMLRRYITKFHPRVDRLSHYFERPLTIIYPFPNKEFVPSLCLSNEGTVAIRIVKEPALSSLIEQLGHAIVSTSGNIHGQPTPRVMEEVSEDIKSRVDFFWEESGNLIKGTQESSVIIRYDDDSGAIDVIR